MKKIYNKIISPLSLILTKGENVGSLKNLADIKTCKGSNIVGCTDMAVLQHYKPIVKI